MEQMFFNENFKLAYNEFNYDFFINMSLYFVHSHPPLLIFFLKVALSLLPLPIDLHTVHMA